MNAPLINTSPAVSDEVRKKVADLRPSPADDAERPGLSDMISRRLRASERSTNSASTSSPVTPTPRKIRQRAALITNAHVLEACFLMMPPPAAMRDCERTMPRTPRPAH